MPTFSAPNHAFASDNTAGVCPEAWTALATANAGYAPSYGDDALSAKARQRFQAVFETDCEVFFVFNGTAANALALAACCRSPHTRILCHEYAHVDTDECGAPEFFTGGAKLIPVSGPAGKLPPAAVTSALHRGHGVHFPRAAAVSLTQSTEWGTLYSPDEIRALSAVAREHGLAVHLDGARFANAAAAFSPCPGVADHVPTLPFASPAELTWRSGVDVLCFGGTKNGLLSTEAVIFFNRDLARDFEYRVKQGGQLTSKMRYAAAQWLAVLEDGAWLRHAGWANRQARRLADGLRALPAVRLIVEPEANGVFVELPPALHDALAARGWRFHRFIGDHGYRLMCSWATTTEEVDAFLADIRDLARGIIK